MSGIPLSFIIEGTVAILLIMTIGYAVILNERLKRLHADRDALRQMVTDLVVATDNANSAIGELKAAAHEADGALEARLEEAERFAIELANHVHAGQSVMDRIAKITEVAQRSEVLSGAPVKAPRASARGAHAALERLNTLRSQEDAA